MAGSTTGSGGSGAAAGSGGATSGEGGGGASSSSSGSTPTWAKRRPLTIDAGADVMIDDFPLAVYLTSSRIDYTIMQAAGEDIRFTASDGLTALPYEIEHWENGGGSLVWVHVPTIQPTGSGKTLIYMYYGNLSASDGQNVPMVWTPDFGGVWHLSQADDMLADSSGNTGMVATNYGTTKADGKVGSGRAFDAALKTYIDTNNVEELSEFTVEGWIYSESPATKFWGGTNGLLMRSKNYRIVWSSPTDDHFASVNYLEESTDLWKVAYLANGLSEHVWYYLVGTFNGVNLRAYRDGKFIHEAVGTAPDADSSTAKIGRHALYANTENHVTGVIDEVRISRIARSDQWIDAQYKSMTDAMGFVTYGDEEMGNFTLR